MAAESLLLLPDADPSSASLENVTVDGARVGWRLKRRTGSSYLNLATGAAVLSPSGVVSYLTDNAHYDTYLQNPLALPINFDLDLGSAKTFDRLEMVGRSLSEFNSTPRAYELFVSDDGVSWGSAVASGEFGVSAPTTGRTFTVTFATQTKRYFRMRVTTNWGGVYCAVGDIRLFNGGRTDLSTVATFTSPGAVGTAIGTVCTDGNIGEIFVYGTNAYRWAFDVSFAASRNIDGFEWWSYSSTLWNQKTIEVWGSHDQTAWELLKTFSYADVSGSGICPIRELFLDDICSYRYWRFVSTAWAAGIGSGMLSEFRIWEASQTSYDTGGPSSEWTHDFGQSCTLASVATREDCEGAATILYQYGFNEAGSPALNGSWLTEAQLATALNGNSGRYLRIAVQFNSNGSDRATFRGIAAEITAQGLNLIGSNNIFL